MAGSDVEPDRLIGTLIGGKYQIERLLGKGGMGAVYQATHRSIGKRVALKFLDRDAARDTAAVARFQREAEAASAIESEHIVHIFDSGVSEDGRPFLVLELLQGEDLRARLQRERRLPIPDVVNIAAQVLRALSRAHAAGIVHRDLKPDNVFLCRRDDEALFVKLVDFGISKIARKTPSSHTLTHQGMVLGTAYYMSPEQAQAFSDVDGRSDLYSLGAIMYEALAGTPPHVGSAYEAILINICTKDAADVRSHAPEVPEALALVVARALSRERDQRYQNAAEFLEALQRADADAGIGAARPSGTLARTPLGSATSVARGDYETVRGTSVRTPVATRDKRHATRTAVAVIVAVLAAFTVTAFLLTGRNKEPDVRPTPETAAAATPAPLPSPAPASSAPAPSLAEPAASVSPSAGSLKKTRNTRRATPTTSAAPSVAQPGKSSPAATGVARGLQLKTTDP